MPFSSFAVTEEPGTDCPNKKKISQEDSVSMYESENKVLEDVETQRGPEKTPVVEKTSYKTIDNNLDESDTVDESDPNSAMSFNFIYYIIDKFKFTDPLE